MTKNELILLLLMLMAVVVTAELAYIMLRRMRRKKEMFRKKKEPADNIADRAHNMILTTESISRRLANQGIDTGEADSLLGQARRQEIARDFSAAIERAEAAKLVLLRVKREHSARQPRPSADPEMRPMDQSIFDAPEPVDIEEVKEERDLDSLPTNYVQSKFMLSTTKDLLEKKGINKGEAYDLFKKANDFFEKEDYDRALSHAIKADRLLGSDNVELIGEEKVEEEVILVCPSCECEVSEDDAFCRECGESLESADECPGCGEPIETTDKFCRKCGHKLW